MSTPVKNQTAATASYATPTKRVAIINAEAGPSRVRPSGSSPAYSSRRHSLYGIEDRIIIDPGSRSWKVGFSGEYEPRAVFPAVNADDEGEEAWQLDLASIEATNGDRAEAGRIVGVRVRGKLQETYIKHLMTDPKARKVIIVENTYLPKFVKDEIAKTLFEHLKVPSVAFTPASVLALASVARSTGLVVDVGWLETTITPVYHSRALCHLARSTPVAGQRLRQRLRALLRCHSIYYSPPSSLSSLTRESIQPVPNDILTDTVIDRILSGCCFVSPPHGDDAPPTTQEGEIGDEEYITYLGNRYRLSANASDVTLRMSPQDGESKIMGPGCLIIPGWLRERVAEVLFGDEEDEAESIPEAILSCLSKLPTDLRSTMISSILVTGFTPSLPGLFSRLRLELVQLLSSITPTPFEAVNPTSSPFRLTTPPLNTPEHRRDETRAWRRRHLAPFRKLKPLVGQLAILNDPSPYDQDVDTGRSDGSSAMGNNGKAPRWHPGLMSWIGGSLAGSLKTGGSEVQREEYDTLLQLKLQRGEQYLRTVEADDIAAAALLNTNEAEAVETDTSVPPPQVDTAVPPTLKQHLLRSEVGVSIDDLLPGMALKGLGRKRGWRNDVAISDWTRVVRA